MGIQAYATGQQHCELGYPDKKASNSDGALKGSDSNDGD
jgi:hypothetical protein